MTVLEIAEETAVAVGDDIFLQSFVLRHFSTVLKTKGRAQQLALQFTQGSNLSPTSKSNS